MSSVFDKLRRFSINKNNDERRRPSSSCLTVPSDDVPTRRRSCGLLLSPEDVTPPEEGISINRRHSDSVMGRSVGASSTLPIRSKDGKKRPSVQLLSGDIKGHLCTTLVGALLTDTANTMIKVSNAYSYNNPIKSLNLHLQI